MAGITPPSQLKFPDLPRMLKEEEERMKTEQKQESEKPVRIWVDGCFDMVHFGHANALRQSKLKGDILVVGIHTDDEICRLKGPIVQSQKERMKMVKAIKWVDEVVVHPSNVTTMDMMDRNNCDYCAHGEDITFAFDGTFSYQNAIEAGRFRVFRRTEGISTTDLVGRILLLDQSQIYNGEKDFQYKSQIKAFTDDETIISSPFNGEHPFNHYNEKIFRTFSEGMIKPPKPDEKVVYVAGAFDLFHTGHVDFLQACLKFGSYIIVGIHDDQVVNSYKGGNYPIMNLEERVLGCLACRYVSDVVIRAPYSVTDELLDYFKVDHVVHGMTPYRPCTDGTDPYEAAKKRGIFQQVDSGSTLNATEIVMRIINNRLKFEERNKRKAEITSQLSN